MLQLWSTLVQPPAQACQKQIRLRLMLRLKLRLFSSHILEIFNNFLWFKTDINRIQKIFFLINSYAGAKPKISTPDPAKCCRSTGSGSATQIFEIPETSFTLVNFAFRVVTWTDTWCSHGYTRDSIELPPPPPPVLACNLTVALVDSLLSAAKGGGRGAKTHGF
jgi:hypothetical protein